jgi:dienelactone hydrolase
VVYYPAVKYTGSKYPLPYFSDSAYLETASNINPTTNMSMIKATARPGAVPLGGSSPWPAVILSPGYGVFIEFSTSLAEQLASHGFVVVAIATTLAEIVSETPDPDTSRKRMDRVREVLDLLEQLSPMCGLVDMRKIAVGGHSLAGTEAFELAARDNRIAAVVDLDGWDPDGTPSPVSVPALLVWAINPDTPPDTSQFGTYLAALKRASQYVKANHVVAVGLQYADHEGVTDIPAIASVLPKNYQPDLGSIGVNSTRITSTIVLRFLKAVFTVPSHNASASELLASLPSVTKDPLGFEKHRLEKLIAATSK